MKLRNAVLSRWWHMKGYLAARQGDYDRAQHHFERALQYRQSTLTRAYRAMVLSLLGRSADARAEFRCVASAVPSASPNAEYARLYAQMFVAYLEDRLIEADLIAEQLRQSDCHPGVRELLFPIERPSLLAADSQLESMGMVGADPMGFRDAHSGVHWMKAVEAYAKRDFDQAIAQVSEAEAASPASPAQRALKAGILANLGRNEEAYVLFDGLVDELEQATSVDESYICLFCQCHRPATATKDRAALLDRAIALSSQTPLRYFLPIGPNEPIDFGQAKFHLQTARNAYASTTIKVAMNTANRPAPLCAEPK